MKKQFWKTQKKIYKKNYKLKGIFKTNKQANEKKTKLESNHKGVKIIKSKKPKYLISNNRKGAFAVYARRGN